MKKKNRAIELLQDRRGKLSRTGLVFLVWMTFLMSMLGIVTWHDKKVADLPEPYVYLTLVLCGTYTARRFLDNKFGTAEKSQAIEPPKETGKTKTKA